MKRQNAGGDGGGVGVETNFIDQSQVKTDKK